MISSDLEHAIARIERLVGEVFRLRQIIAQSRADARLLDKPGFRLIHVIDTPIFDLYAQPDAASRMIAALPSLTDDRLAAEVEEDIPPGMLDARGSAPTAAERTLYATALLTGEYIFKLASGPSEHGVLVAPEHVPEVYGYVQSLESRARHLYARRDFDTLFSSVAHILRGQEGAFAGHRIEASTWIQRVRRVVGEMSRVSQNDLLAPHRLRLLFEKRLVRNAGDDPEFAAAETPSFEEVQSWKRAVRSAKERNRIKPNPHAVEADAATLAQLAALNANWEQKKRAYVLVTSDGGLHRAYASWVARERVNGRRRTFFALRDPRQYVPILNVSDMEGAYRAHEIFDSVQSAIDAVVSPFATGDFAPATPDGYADPSSIPDHSVIEKNIGDVLRGSADRMEPHLEQINQQIEEIGARWIEAVESSIVAKADILAEIAADISALWTHANARDNLDSMFKARVSALGSSVEKFATGSALLRQEAWAVETGIGADAPLRSYNRRLISSEFRDFSSAAFAGRTLDEIAKHYSATPTDAKRELTAVDPRERLLFTGSLCIRIGAYTGAKTLLSRISLGPDRTSRMAQEIRYHVAVSLRLAATLLDYKKEYAAARSELLDLIRIVDRANDAFAFSRLMNEALSLETCEIAFHASQRAPLGDTLRRALGAWTNAHQHAEFLLGNGDRPWGPLRRQFYLNSWVLFFWCHVGEVTVPKALEQVVKAGLDLISARVHSDIAEGPHGELYPLLAQWVTADRAAQRAGLAAKIRTAIEGFQKWDAASGFAYDLPVVDKEEFNEILRLIEPVEP